jgi:CBS domain-containing protein
VIARDVMSDAVMSVAADATVYEAATLLVNAQVSAMPVVDGNGTMLGIVSEADLLERSGAGDASKSSGLLGQLAADIASARSYVRAKSHRVVDVMTKPVICVEEDTPLNEIAQLMLDTGIKRVPVRRGHSVVGMVSRIDLVRALISQRADAVAQPTLAAALPEAADEKLRRDIESAVRGRSWSLARRADVVVKDGIAHLWGVVPSDIVLQAYCVAAENVPGVKSVESHMHVVPPSPMRLGL